MLQGEGELAVLICGQQGEGAVLLQNDRLLRKGLIVFGQGDNEAEFLVLITVDHGLGHLQRALCGQAVGDGGLAVLCYGAALIERHRQFAGFVGVFDALFILRGQTGEGMLPFVGLVQLDGLALHPDTVLVQLHRDALRTGMHPVIVILPDLFHAEGGFVGKGVFECVVLAEERRGHGKGAVAVIADRYHEGMLIHRVHIARLAIIAFVQDIAVLAHIGFVVVDRLKDNVAVRVIGGRDLVAGLIRYHKGELAGLQRLADAIGNEQLFSGFHCELALGVVGIGEGGLRGGIRSNGAAFALADSSEARCLRLFHRVQGAHGQVVQGEGFAVHQIRLHLTARYQHGFAVFRSGAVGAGIGSAVGVLQGDGEGERLGGMGFVGRLHLLGDGQMPGFHMVGDHRVVHGGGNDAGQFAIAVLIHCRNGHPDPLGAVIDGFVHARHFHDNKRIGALLREGDGIEAHDAASAIAGLRSNLIVRPNQLEGELAHCQLAANQLLGEFHKGFTAEAVSVGEAAFRRLIRLELSAGALSVGLSPAGQVAGFRHLVGEAGRDARQGEAFSALEGDGGLAAGYSNGFAAAGNAQLRASPGHGGSIGQADLEGEFPAAGCVGQGAVDGLGQLQAAGLGLVAEHQLIRSDGFAALGIGHGGAQVAIGILAYRHGDGVFRAVVRDSGVLRIRGLGHGIGVGTRFLKGEGIEHHAAASSVFLCLRRFGGIFVGGGQNKGESLRLGGFAIQQLAGPQGYRRPGGIVAVGEGGGGGDRGLDLARVVGLAHQHPAGGQFLPHLVGGTGRQVVQRDALACFELDGNTILSDGDGKLLFLPLGGKGDDRIGSIPTGGNGAGAVLVEGIFIAATVLEAGQFVGGADEGGGKGVCLHDHRIRRTHCTGAFGAGSEEQLIRCLMRHPCACFVKLFCEQLFVGFNLSGVVDLDPFAVITIFGTGKGITIIEDRVVTKGDLLHIGGVVRDEPVT